MMFTPKMLKKYALPCVVSLSSVFGSVAYADPVILPPGELNNVPNVFCFKVTGGDELAGGGARLQFEILNWTGEAAHFIEVRQNPFSAANTGGLFSPVIPDQPNGWHVQDFIFGEVPVNEPGQVLFGASEDDGFGIDFGLAEVPQNPLEGIDLDPNNDLDFSDGPTIPNPIDSGINVLDGFVLDFPDLDVFERVVLQWTLFDQNFNNVDSTFNEALGGFIVNPFSFGTFQIDRASNGSIRVATYFGIGQTLDDVEDFNQGPNGFEFDIAATNANAVTLAPTSLAAVPVPAAAWLFMSGLLGLVGVSRRRKTA